MKNKKIIKILLIIISIILVAIIFSRVVIPFAKMEMYMNTIEKMEVEFINIPENLSVENKQVIETDYYKLYIDKELEYDEEFSYEDETFYSNELKSIRIFNYINENVSMDEFQDADLKMFSNSVDKYILISKFDRDDYSFFDKEDLLTCSILLFDAMSYNEDMKIFVGENEYIKFSIQNIYTNRDICAISFVNIEDNCEYSLTISGYSVEECVDIISTIEFK